METKAEKTIAKANREAIYAAIAANPLFDVKNIASPRIAREATRQLNKLCLSLPNSKKLLALFKQIDNAGDHIYHEVFTDAERAADDVHCRCSHAVEHISMHREYTLKNRYTHKRTEKIAVTRPDGLVVWHK